jgi:hypothetical protein
MDWLIEKQESIENELAKRHLEEGALVLYDLSSTYFEGTQCPLAKFGYNRDKKKGVLQIVFGLLCDKRGCPIEVEVFEGNTTDSFATKGIRFVVSFFNLYPVRVQEKSLELSQSIACSFLSNRNFR